MNLRQLEVFRAVMRCQTLTDAARMLNVSQPAVSKVLQHAEDQLGIRLFERIRGRLYPTLEAEALFPDAERIFRELTALQRLTRDLRKGEAGLVRVGATSSLGLSIVPEAISAFKKDWKGVKVISHLLPAAEIADLAMTHQIDVGVTLSPVSTPTARVAVKGGAEMVCLMPSSHPLTTLDEVGPRDIANHSFISFPAGTHFRELIDAVFRSAGVTPQADLEVAYSVAAYPLVQRGGGVALVDGFTVPLGLPGLTWRPFRPRIPVRIYMITAAQRPGSSFAQRFAGYLEGAITRCLTQARTTLRTPGGARRRQCDEGGGHGE